MGLVAAFCEGFEIRSKLPAKHPFAGNFANYRIGKFQKSAEFEVFSPFGAFFV
jgi:hypothetical protein